MQVGFPGLALPYDPSRPHYVWTERYEFSQEARYLVACDPPSLSSYWLESALCRDERLWSVVGYFPRGDGPCVLFHTLSDNPFESVKRYFERMIQDDKLESLVVSESSPWKITAAETVIKHAWAIKRWLKKVVPAVQGVQPEDVVVFRDSDGKILDRYALFERDGMWYICSVYNRVVAVNSHILRDRDPTRVVERLFDEILLLCNPDSLKSATINERYLPIAVRLGMERLQRYQKWVDNLLESVDVQSQLVWDGGPHD